MTETALIVVAAGLGTRAGRGTPKQWHRIAGRSVLEHALAPFRAEPRIGRIVVVARPEDLDGVRALGVIAVAGGATRAASVRAGLAVLEVDPPHDVLIHDAARATCPREVITAVLDALEVHPAAAPGVPVSDTLWRADVGTVSAVVPRDGLVAAQTPQGFRFATIRELHQKSASDQATDDVSLAIAAGFPVTITPGHPDNLKITTPADFVRAERLLRSSDMRIGSGFDIHRFTTGDHVTLGGVRIPHDKGIEAHSDGDVVLHALSDAIYGALADGDIGTHFPPSEPAWKAADSRLFLAHAGTRAALRGFRLTNIDVTILAERPKISQYSAAMRESMARILGLGMDRISIKATTMERLGAIGREEGIAAQATVLLEAA